MIQTIKLKIDTDKTEDQTAEMIKLTLNENLKIFEGEVSGKFKTIKLKGGKK